MLAMFLLYSHEVMQAAEFCHEASRAAIQHVYSEETQVV